MFFSKKASPKVDPILSASYDELFYGMEKYLESGHKDLIQTILKPETDSELAKQFRHRLFSRQMGSITKPHVKPFARPAYQ